MTAFARKRFPGLGSVLGVGLLVFSLCSEPAWAQNSDPMFDLLEYYQTLRHTTAELMERATVWVIADGRRTISNGSGFVVAPGYVLTNAHVISGEENMKFYIMNEYLPLTKAVLIAQEYDRRSESGNDFALLAFNPPDGLSLPVLSFDLEIRRMDRVSAWGYPSMVTRWDRSVSNMRTNIENIQGAPPVVYTEGTVSTLVNSRGSSIIHTAAIAAGNSGGPLVNERGEVVGINTWGYTEDGEGAFINAALTSTEIVRFLRENGIEPRLADSSTNQASWEPGQLPTLPNLQPAPDDADWAVSPVPQIPLGERPLWLEIALHTGEGDFAEFFSLAQDQAQIPPRPEPKPTLPNLPEQPEQPAPRPGKVGDNPPGL